MNLWPLFLTILGPAKTPYHFFFIGTLYWPSWFTVIWLIAAWAHPTSKVDSLTKQLYPLCDCNVPKCLSCHMSPPNEGFFHPPCPNKGHLSKICMVLLERPLKCGDCFLQEFEWSLLGIIFKIWWKLMVLWVGQMTSCFGDLYSFDCLKRGVWEHCHFEHDRSLQNWPSNHIFLEDIVLLQ